MTQKAAYSEHEPDLSEAAWGRVGQLQEGDNRIRKQWLKNTGINGIIGENLSGP